MESKGLKTGNKIKSQVTIPQWIIENKKFLQACLKGLIDTDGCIHHMSKRDHNLLRITFTNYNQKLLYDTRAAFIKLGFNPSKIIRSRDFYLSRQEEIRKYLKEIGFSNKKHIDRFSKLSAPSYSWSSTRASGARNLGSNPGGAMKLKVR